MRTADRHHHAATLALWNGSLPADPGGERRAERRRLKGLRDLYREIEWRITYRLEQLDAHVEPLLQEPRYRRHLERFRPK